MTDVLLDINVLVALFVEDHSHKNAAEDWLGRALAEERAILVPEEVCAGFVRVVRNRSYLPELKRGVDLAFLRNFLGLPSVEVVLPSPSRLWPALAFVEGLGLGPKGVGDAMLAAIAIERGAALTTFDKGFAKFEGLTLEPMLAQATD